MNFNFSLVNMKVFSGERKTLTIFVGVFDASVTNEIREVVEAKRAVLTVVCAFLQMFVVVRIQIGV